MTVPCNGARLQVGGPAPRVMIKAHVYDVEVAQMEAWIETTP